jgi:DNA polymerase-3 subunit delta'
VATDSSPSLILHQFTQLAVNDYIAEPVHAVLLTGPSGSGKASLARYIVSSILDISINQPEKYESYRYIRIIRPVDTKAIPIDSIRELQHFLSLSIPGVVANRISRAVVIEDADRLTGEAQNALLKTLEEPPTDTIIILTATSSASVLPTIQSRVRLLAVLPPAANILSAHFTARGYNQPEIGQALMLSGSLPGLATALLAEDSDHPLVKATIHARGILQSKTYQRLLLVDGFSKQKPLCLDILFVLGQMARTALLRATDQKIVERWQRIMRVTYTAGEQLRHNSGAKLVLTNLMLEL